MKKLLAAFLLVLFTVSVSPAETGKKNEKIFGATFPATFILYIMDPDIIIGWNGPLRAYEKKYIPEKYQKLPIVGGWYGQGIVPDKEVLIREGVKKALIITSGTSRDNSVIDTLKSLNIDSMVLRGRTMQDYIDIFRSLGMALGMEERGNALAAYAENSIIKVNTMMQGYPEDKRLKVYFAQGANGLETFCGGNYRSEAIEMAGGKQVHVCPDSAQDMVTISFEQLMNYDPDVILIQEQAFASKYKDDPKWQRLRAVKTGRVYPVPFEPFSWLDRPPSYMRFLGAQWLVCQMHPDRCSVNIEDETKKFMKLFFHIDITDQQLKEILLK